MSRIAKQIANDIMTINDTKTIVIYEPTNADYNEIHNYIFLRLDILKLLEINSGISHILSIKNSYMAFRNAKNNSFIIIGTDEDLYSDNIEITYIYCKDADEFSKIIIGL